MTGVAELNYLINVELLRKGAVSPETAISVSELYAALEADVPKYIEWVKREKFNRFFRLGLGISIPAGNPDYAESMESEEYANLAYDRKADRDDFQDFGGVKYWLQNGGKKGISFSGGIKPDDLRRLTNDGELPAVENIEDVKTDVDLVGFVNTWLEKNWRT